MKKKYQLKRYTRIIFILVLFVVYSLNFSFLQAQDLNDKESRKNFKEAEKAYNKGSYKEAMEFYFNVIRVNPDHIESLYKIALIDYDVNKRYSEAKKRFIKTRDIIRNYLKQANNGLSEKEKVAYQDLQAECNNKASSCDTREKEYKNNKAESSDNLQIKQLTQAKTQLETAKTVKVEKKSEEKNYDNIDPEMEYIDREIIIFNSKDENKQRKQLINHVDSIYNSKKWKNGFSGRHTEEQIRSIDNRWMRENSQKNMDWIKDLNDLERDYIEKQNFLNARIDARRNILLQISSIGLEKKNVEEKIKQENRLLDAIQRKIDNDIRENFNEKLTNIPISLVMVGRAEFSGPNIMRIKNLKRNNIINKKEATIVKEFIDDNLRVHALNLIKGPQITTYYNFLSSDQTLKSIKLKQLSGRAQIATNFYKAIKKSSYYDNNKKTEYIYSIVRIEIFPFEIQTEINNSIQTNNQISTEDINVDAFVINKNNSLNSLERISDNKSFDIDGLEIGFGETHKGFLLSIQEESESLNNQYRLSIDEAYKDYELSLQKAKDEKNIIVNKRDSLEKVYRKYQSEEEELNRKYKNDKEFELAKKTYKDSKNKYDDKYKTKKTYTNKIEVLNTEYFETTQDRIPQYMATNCYSKIDEMKNEIINISVLVENDGSDDIKQNSKNVIKYQPQATGFQVITFDSRDEAENSIFYMHIAFELTWTERERDTIKFEISEEKNGIAKNEFNKSSETDNLVLNDTKENVAANTDNQQNNSEVIPEIPIQTIINEEIAENSIENNSQNEINTNNAQVNLQTGVIINEGAKTITDNDNRLVFMFFNDNPTSFKSWHKSRDGEWRLPSDNELRIFLKIAQQKKLEGNNFAETFNSFMECYNFIYDNAYKNEEGTSFHQGFLLNPDNFEFTPQNFEDTESVHIVMVKNF